MNAKGLAGIIAGVILFTLAKMYVWPWWQMRDVESKLQEIPAYAALKEHDPSTYDRVMSELRKGAEGSRNEAQTIAAVRKQIEDIVKARIPKASNEAVVKYIGVTMIELDELYERGDDTCHSFLFPQPGDALDARKFFSAKTQKADLAALAVVIETSAKNPQELPSEEEFMQRLMPVAEELAGEYGEDVALVQNPTAPGIDKRKVCQVVRGLYSKILALPADDAGKVLRYMIANS
jgi:hypothetical protein